MEKYKISDWEKYWREQFAESWQTFEGFALSHYLFDKNKSIYEQDFTMMVGILSDFFHEKGLNSTPYTYEKIYKGINAINGARQSLFENLIDKYLK